MFKQITLFSAFFALLATAAFANAAQDISQQDLQKLMASDQKTAVVLLDVRTPEEYAAGHVPGAINISHTKVKANLAKLLAHKNDTVVVYCRSGRRAGMAAEILAENGFTKVRHLSGDMNGWYKAKLPVEK